MIYQTLFFLAQASPAPGQGQTTGPAGSGTTMLVYMVCIGVIFYFLVVRPQSTKQKEHDRLVKSIKSGDKVVTSGGIHGLISNVKEGTVIVKIADNVKIEIDKSAIVAVSKSVAAET